jgi:hypothetical protein
MLDNSEIVIIQPLRNLVPRPEVLVFYHRKASPVKETCSTRASKIVCTSSVVLSHDPLSPTPSHASAMKTSENTEEDLDGLKLVDNQFTALRPTKCTTLFLRYSKTHLRSPWLRKFPA